MATRTPPDRITVKLPADLQAELDQAARDRLLGRDRLLEVLLRDGLRRLVPVDDLVLLRRPGVVDDPGAADAPVDEKSDL